MENLLVAEPLHMNQTGNVQGCDQNLPTVSIHGGRRGWMGFHIVLGVGSLLPVIASINTATHGNDARPLSNPGLPPQGLLNIGSGTYYEKSNFTFTPSS